MQGKGSGFPFQGLAQAARGEQSFSCWQQSTGRDEKKLSDLILQDQLSVLLGGCRSTCSAWSGMWDLGQRFLVQHFSGSPGRAAVPTRMGDPALVVSLWGLTGRGLTEAAEVRSRNQHSREDQPGGGNLSWPLPCHQTLVSGALSLDLIQSHQYKVENFGKWHHFISEADRILMWTEETTELKTEAAKSWK